MKKLNLISFWCIIFATISLSAKCSGGACPRLSFAAELSSFTVRARHIVTIAHRGGAKYAPENTLAAFKNAVKIGVDYVELDVHLSKDGELVVIHDDTVNRTTDSRGRVSKMTLEELKELDAGSKFSEEFKGEKIPTLREVLEEVIEDVGVVIEIKGKEPEIVPKVAELIEELEVADRVLIHSFSPETIKKFRQLKPEVTASIDLTQASQNIWQDYICPALMSYTNIITFNNMGPREVVPDLIREAHLAGLSVWFGVANKEEDMRWVIEQGVDGIFTDDPVLLKRLCEQMFFESVLTDE